MGPLGWQGRLNFKNLPENYEFSKKNVLDMRGFNSELIRYDQQYTIHVLNQDWQPDNRISLREMLFNLKMK